MSDTIPQLGDPFSATPSQQSGFLGQSPGFWQHLAMFGGNLAAAANARTPSGHLAYGTGFAGPFGAAIGETAQQSLGQAVAGANIGRSQAETVGINQQNQLNHARNSFMQMLYQNPDAMNAFMQNGTLPGVGGGMGAGGAPGVPNGILSSGGSVGGPLASTVANLESGGRTSTPGIVGDGGKAAGPMQVHQAALQDVNGKLGTNYTLPQLSANPQLGTQVGNVYLQMQQDKFPGRPDLALAAYNAGPGATQRAVQSGQGLAALPASTQSYVARGMGGAAPAGYDTSAGFTMANQLEHEADVAERSKSLGLPVGRDPAALRQAAQAYRQSALAAPTAGAAEGAKLQQQLQYQPQLTGANKAAEANVEMQTAGPIAGAKKAAEANVELRTAGAIQAQKSANSNVDLREGGMSRMVGADGQPEWIKNPKLEEVIDPSTGQKTYAHISPALPGSAPGTAGTSEPVVGAGGAPVVKSIPPNIQDARNKAYTEFAGKDTDTFQAATNTQGVLAQMNEAARTLNQAGGLLGTGPTAPARIAFASKVNDVLRTAGLPGAFDPNAVGSWEELTKATKTAGFELSSHYEGHARQAAQTIENATSAVPGEMNSPIGFAKVFAGINEQAQMGMDLHNAKLPAYNSGGDIVNAETDFINKYPAQMYSRRAISTVTPYPIGSDKELGRYLPGTFVTYKGNVVQVPPRPGAPPIPDYVHEMQQPQPGQAAAQQ